MTVLFWARISVGILSLASGAVSYVLAAYITIFQPATVLDRQNLFWTAAAFGLVAFLLAVTYFVLDQVHSKRRDDLYEQKVTTREAIYQKRIEERDALNEQRAREREAAYEQRLAERDALNEERAKERHREMMESVTAFAKAAEAAKNEHLESSAVDVIPEPRDNVEA